MASLPSRGRKKKSPAPLILVPIDFSPESRRALDYAALLRRAFGGTLHLVHVHDVDSNYAVPSVLLLPPVIPVKDIDRHYKNQLKKLAAKHSAQIHVKIGRAFDQICRLAEELEAQLIVISTHGNTGWKRLLLGSTAEGVVRHATCPVLVVRRRERDFAALKPTRHDSKTSATRMKILVPVDFSAGARAALRHALFFAHAWHAELTILHAVQMQPVIAADHLAAYNRTPSLAAIERAARTQMQGLLDGFDLTGVPYTTVIQVGNPAQQINQYAEDHGSDLIITATQGQTGLARVLIGSVAEHVVRHANCPVLVVPERKKRGKDHRDESAKPRRRVSARERSTASRPSPARSRALASSR